MASGDIVRIGGLQKYEYQPVISYISIYTSDTQYPSLTEVLNVQGSGFISSCFLKCSGGSSGSANARLEIKVDGQIIFLDGHSTAVGASGSTGIIAATNDMPGANHVILPYIAPSPYTSRMCGVFHELLRFNTSCVVRIIATTTSPSLLFRFLGGVLV